MSDVLIVDDDDITIEVIKKMLGDDHNVASATNGKTAIQMAQARSPDLILLDVMMPEMNGYEVCRRLKSDPATNTIPIIFITAKDTDLDQVAGLKMGVVDYIVKPFNTEIVKAKLNNHLKAYQAREASQAPIPVRHVRREMDYPRSSRGETGWRSGLGSMAMGAALALIVGIGFGTAKFIESPASASGSTSTVAASSSSVSSPAGVPANRPNSNWVKNSTCGDIPIVSWWGTVTKATVVRYVNSKHNGEWQPYIDKWQHQAEYMANVYARGSMAKTKDGTQLHGDVLATHVEKLRKRVAVIKCLARESALAKVANR